MELPVYGVAEHAKVEGCDNLEQIEGATPLALATFEEAFTRPWLVDAHFVCYAPVGEEEGTLFPRCNKPLLSKLREAGGDLASHTVALDWDTPFHEPWETSKTTIEDFFEQYAKACERLPFLASPNALYTTRAGVRLVYVLDRPVPVDEFEPKILGLIYACREAGFLVDESGKEWNRLFRLPMVLRDGAPSGSLPSFDLSIDLDARLPVDSLRGATRGNRPATYGPIREFDDPKPTPEEAAACLTTLREGRQVMTEWAKTAKRRLKGRECWDCIYENKPLAEQGARDSTIHAHVGQIVSLLARLEDTTPTHIYALLLPAVEQLEPDAQTPDWTDILWSAVGRLWVKEEAKVEAEQIDRREKYAERQDQINDLVHGMRQWCEHEGLCGAEEDAKLWASGRLIVSSGVSYYLIDPDGTYRPQAFNSSQLVPAIRRHIPELIQTTTAKQDGSQGDIPVTSILNKHATVVDRVEYQPGIQGGFIRNIDTPAATLVLPCFHLNPKLSPKFDSDVDAWLQTFFGENYEAGCRWIAYALAFDEGSIAALSIVGDPGAGKKLLVQGLAECLATPALASDAELVGQYQYGLLETPFIVVNEGWSQGYGGKHAADRFREIVSGDVIEVNRRYRDPVRIKSCARVIFTANNLNVIKVLADKRDLTQADREALAVRLLHFDIKDIASKWLQAKGGMAFTAAEGRKWIAPPTGGESDYIVARHFLWLYSKRHRWAKDSRLLVEGHGADELMFELQTGVGTAPLVIETILAMLDSKVPVPGLVIRDGKELFTTSAAVVEYFRTCLAQKVRDNLTTNKVATVLQGLTMYGEDAVPMLLEGFEKLGRRRWYRLDTLKILAAAERHGFRSENLEKIAGKWQSHVSVAKKMEK